jgi:hypothetical protein
MFGAGTSLLFHPVHCVAHASSDDDDDDDDVVSDQDIVHGPLLMTDSTNFRTVELLWDDHPVGSFPVAVDGINNEHSFQGTDVSLVYQLPKTWNEMYYVERGVKCCNHITVYQKTGSARIDALEKAARLEIPVARALDIGDRIGSGLKDLKRANLIRSRSDFKDNGQQYFEFDMTFAPETCDSSAGITCPAYNAIFLISATVLNKRLFVCVIQCDESQWKQAGNDLGRVRSSFKVTDCTR